MDQQPVRRKFITRMGALLAAASGPLDGTQMGATPATGGYRLPEYACLQDYVSLKQSSFNRTGGNSDNWRIDAGQIKEVFNSEGPGVITHLWFTIASGSQYFLSYSRSLKEVVLRMYWDGNPKPSVEAPIGDFFGLNLAEYFVYQSAFLNCSSVRALNSYFAMPFRKSARITVANEGPRQIELFSNIDYQLVPNLTNRSLYFHAQYRQAAPNTAVKYSSRAAELNLTGEHNYVYAETRGTGQLMGVTLGVLQNTDGWMGEGDDMIFVDSDREVAINGTGSEDYFCGAWAFGDREGSVPFAHLYNGAPLIAAPGRTGGRYCLYRWHADNPVTFKKSLKHTMEHGHANNRADSYYSVCYWYQTAPFSDFPILPSAAERIPTMHGAAASS